MHPKPYSGANIISNSVIDAIVRALVNHDASQRLFSPARFEICPLSCAAWRRSLRCCATTKQEPEVIRCKIDVLVGSVTLLFTSANHRRTGVSAPHRAECCNSRCYQISCVIGHRGGDTHLSTGPRGSVTFQGFLSRGV